MPTKPTSVMTPVGKTIRKVRLDKNISHAKLADATGLSIDDIKKIESGETRPPVGTLLLIARALEIDSGAGLKAKNTDNRIAAYTKRIENNAYTTLTPGAADNHIKAFRITIHPDSEHEGVDYQHLGEEFVYVLSGRIEVDVGQNRKQLKIGESFLFDSGIQHKIRNPGKQPTELLVVIYTP